MSTPRDVATVLGTGGIRYSQVWEDHALLEDAMQPARGEDVLSIAGAGDNVLNLLLQGPRRIVALDINPAQTALLRLKLAAFQVLTHAEVVSLLGVRAWSDPLTLYERLRPHLDLTTRAFWDSHEDVIETGVIHAGRLERYFAGFRRDVVGRLGLAGAVTALLDAPTLWTQVRLFEQHFATPQFEHAFIAYFGRRNMAEHGRDASQLRYVAHEDVGRVFWQRFRAACTTRLLFRNFYLEYLLTGRYPDLWHGPPYLRPGSFSRVQRGAPAVSVVTASLEDFLPACQAARFAGVNLSNVLEYLSDDEASRLLDSLARVMRPGGHLCFWNLLVPRSIPLEQRRSWRTRPGSACEQATRDRTGFYSAFHVEEAIAA